MGNYVNKGEEMQEFGTEALDKLRKACADLVRKGECRMECETLGAQVGFCRACLIGVENAESRS